MKKIKINSNRELFQEALNFVAVAQNKLGSLHQTHVCMNSDTIFAFNGVLAAGHISPLDLQSCPHTETLLSALKSCTDSLSITQLDSGRLSLKSDRFLAYVPCVDKDKIIDVHPDPRCGILTNKLRDAFLAIDPIISESSPHVVMMSALLSGRSIFATNRTLLLEYWHGIDLPENIVLPKTFISKMCSTKKDLTAFGFSETTFTVYFEDKSWLRTQLYKTTWPPLTHILDKSTTPEILVNNFFAGIAALRKLSDNNRLYLTKDGMSVKKNGDVSGSYLTDPLPHVTLNIDDILLLKDLVTDYDLLGQDSVTYFYGDVVRCALTQFKE